MIKSGLKAYNNKNVERKRSWRKQDELPQTTPKQNIHTKKVMLYI